MSDSQEYMDALVDNEEPKESASVTELALEMKKLKAEVEVIESTLKPIKERYDYVRKRLLPDAMAEQGFKNVKLAEGGSIYVSKKTYAGVKKEDQADFFNWLRDNGHAGLIQPFVHNATLVAWVEELQEMGVTPPPMVSIYEEPLAVLRKS